MRLTGIIFDAFISSPLCTMCWDELTTELSLDPTIRSHLAALYDTLLEQNLLRIIEPYGCVELEHVAKGVGQSRATVEKKLSQMILDKVFYGVLDQGNGWLVVFDEPVVDVSTLFFFWSRDLDGCLDGRRLYYVCCSVWGAQVVGLVGC